MGIAVVGIARASDKVVSNCFSLSQCYLYCKVGAPSVRGYEKTGSITVALTDRRTASVLRLVTDS